ncbi:plasmid partitioning protein RepB [Bradyrhizobium elkanii]|uniref:plasmid partitioning protein RepB n=1 Tax=Bradyrhizobium elkanii TaxID=29448 RepID=UPI003512161E
MSRKNVFKLGEKPEAKDGEPARAQPPVVQHSPALNKFSSVLQDAAEGSRRAERLQKELDDLNKNGVVQDVDTALIDPSPIRDRLDDPESAENDSLRSSIAESGQRVPALLRPNPSAPGRYFTVFGHRRVAAVKALNRPLRAVVTDISEEDALVAQGQENNERKNTSFIERCLFARRLKDRGLKGEQLIAAISGGKANVYKMIEIAEKVPEDIIVAIGPAPSIGRPRWLSLAEIAPSKLNAFRKKISDPEFVKLPSDERFQAIFDLASKADSKKSSADDFSRLKDRNGADYALVRRSPAGDLTLKLPKDDGSARADGRSFGEWFESRLIALRDDWLEGR